MAALDVDTFRSKQFVFIIGEAEAEFSVHAALIAKQSKALDVLINGSMKEASDGKATLEDTEEDTFLRFCQFAYTGDYTTPDFTHMPAVELPHDSPPVVVHEMSREETDVAVVDEPVPVPFDDNFGWGTSSQKPKKAKKPSKSSLLRQSLQNQVYDAETTRTSLAARCEVRHNSDPTENYTTVFLGYAQLYVFAEKWGVQNLKTLTLFKLHRTLTTFTLYEARRPDIVALLRFAFCDDHTPDLVDDVDDLRSLIMLYSACEVESLMHCPEFLQLISEGGRFSQSLFQVLMQRIS